MKTIYDTGLYTYLDDFVPGDTFKLDLSSKSICFRIIVGHHREIDAFRHKPLLNQMQPT